MLNVKERQGQLNSMKVTELKELAKGYGIKVSGSKKAELIDNILMIEEEIHDEEYQAELPTWWNLAVEMNMKDGNPHVYTSVKDRPAGQQIILYTCRELYVDSLRAEKAANRDKTVKGFNYVFVATKSDKYKGQLCMKNARAKACVKAVAGQRLSEKDKKKYLDNKGNFKQVNVILDKLHEAGLIHGNDTDKDYAKFYSINPKEILAFLEAVGCIKKN